MITDSEVLDAMKSHGGGFVKSLAAAANLADPENLGRIRAAFPDYWRDYTVMAEHIKSKAMVGPFPAQKGKDA